MRKSKCFGFAVRLFARLPFSKAMGGLVVLAVILSGCAGRTAPAKTPAEETQVDAGPAGPVIRETARRKADTTILASGEIVPATWADLSSKHGGIVEEMLVEPGEQVSAGMPLVRLDTTDLMLALQIAREEEVALRAVLNQLIEGASDQVVVRADRENAYQIAQAEIALEERLQELERTRGSDPAKDVEAAQTQVRQLELQLAQAHADDPTPKVTAAQVEVERARMALEGTQDEYNQALDRPWEAQKLREAWAEQLGQTQLDSVLAQAGLDLALNEQAAHTIGLEALAVQLQEAQIELSQAVDAQEVYTVTLDILEAEVRAAQLELEHLREWENPYLDEPSDDAIAETEARLRQAELAVAAVEQQIEDAEVCAPFDGTVATVHTRAGELVSPGQHLVTLADLTTLLAKTTDLDEIDVARVQFGQRATITIDALPKRLFEGRVVHISLIADAGAKGVYYTVGIELGEPDPALRWGMTAFIEIEIGE